MVIYEIFREAMTYILGATMSGTVRGELFIEYGSLFLCAWTIYGVIKFFCGLLSMIGSFFK